MPHGVSDASIYKWKAKFGGMDVSEAKPSEFVSRDLDIWVYQKGVVLDFSRPDNSFVESGRFRTECLNTRWFLGR